MGSLTQPVIGMPCKKSIDADHCEHRLTADAVDRCFELGCKIIIFACLRKQRPDPFADTYIAPLCCSTNPLSELDGDMYLESFGRVMHGLLVVRSPERTAKGGYCLNQKREHVKNMRDAQECAISGCLQSNPIGELATIHL